MAEENKTLVTPTRIGTKNAAPTLHPKLKTGLLMLSATVKATDDPELVRAAKYCAALAEYMDSEAYKTRAEKLRQANEKSRAKRGLKPIKKPLFAHFNL